MKRFLLRRKQKERNINTETENKPTQYSTARQDQPDTGPETVHKLGMSSLETEKVLDSRSESSCLSINFESKLLARQSISSVEPTSNTVASWEVAPMIRTNAHVVHGSDPRPPLFEVPFERLPYFSGRQRILEELRSQLEQNGTITLVGEGGIGKSQCALEYAYQFREKYDMVFWAECGTDSAIEQGFLRLARCLGFEQNGPVVALSLLVDWLMKTGRAWLLILDNLDNIDGLLDGQLGALENEPGWSKHVLCTSRDPRPRTVFSPHTIEVLPLNDQESRELVAYLLMEHEEQGEDDEQSLLELVRSLGGQPLALAHASFFIQTKNCTISNFLGLYKGHETEIRNSTRYPSISSHHSIQMVLDVCFRALSPGAYKLLSLMAMFSPDSISREILPSSSNGKFVPDFKLNFVKCKSELLRSSLVSRVVANDTLSMHRLVQSYVRSQLSRETLASLEQEAIHILFRNVYQSGASIQSVHLMPHIETVLRYAPPDGQSALEQACLAFNAATTLLASGISISLARVWTIKAIDIINEFGEWEHLRGFQCHVLAGRISLHQCDFESARQHFRKAEYQCRINASCSDSDLRDIHILIATIDYQVGNYTDAEVKIRSVLDHQRLGNIEAFQSVDALHVLAMVLQAVGKRDQAASYATNALNKSMEMLGPHHAATLLIMTVLDEILESFHDFVQATELLQNVVNHSSSSKLPGTLNALNELTSILMLQERWDEAKELALTVSIALSDNRFTSVPAVAFRNLELLSLIAEKKDVLNEAEILFNQPMTKTRQYLEL